MKCLIIGVDEDVVAQLVQLHMGLLETPQVVSPAAAEDLKLADFNLFILRVTEFDAACMSWLRNLRRQTEGPVIFLHNAGAPEEIIVRIAGITRDPAPIVVDTSRKMTVWTPDLYTAIDAVTATRV